MLRTRGPSEARNAPDFSREMAAREFTLLFFTLPEATQEAGRKKETAHARTLSSQTRSQGPDPERCVKHHDDAQARI